MLYTYIEMNLKTTYLKRHSPGRTRIFEYILPPPLPINALVMPLDTSNYFTQFLLYRFREKNKELNSSNCDENVGCQVQHTKMVVEDTVITCKVLNSAGGTTRYIYIKAIGKSSKEL